jgi:hypothetical protein
VGNPILFKRLDVGELPLPFPNLCPVSCVLCPVSLGMPMSGACVHVHHSFDKLTKVGDGRGWAVTPRSKSITSSLNGRVSQTYSRYEARKFYSMAG